MKIYEVFSWPVKNNVPQKPKRYFFTNSKAANKFVEYLNKVEPDYPHHGVELIAYDTCCDFCMAPDKGNKVCLNNQKDINTSVMCPYFKIGEYE